MRSAILFGVALAVCWQLTANGAVEEQIIGVLEKTAKPGACAQIEDALKETYYIVKTDEAAKACEALFGKKVEVSGVVEERTGDPAYYFRLKRTQLYRPGKAKGGSEVKPIPIIDGPLPPAPDQPGKKPDTSDGGETHREGGTTGRSAEGDKVRTEEVKK